jgi:hypothetical protein
MKPTKIISESNTITITASSLRRRLQIAWSLLWTGKFTATDCVEEEPTAEDFEAERRAKERKAQT